jgi:alpha-L-fucosidase 2
MYFWGLPNNGDYGWGNTAAEPANGYIRRYWNGGLELIAVMLDRYDFTQDQDFARSMLVPLAEPLIAFLDQYWQKRDANGKIIFDPAQSLETWHVAVNPLPEIAGLRFVLPRLLALPENITTESQRSHWTRMLQELPPVPVANVDGVPLLRPADTFSACANSENPELYAVFPYRLYGVGRPDLDMARATYERRTNRHNHGWCQDSIQAACLGLGEEAGRLVSARAAQVNPGNRFPAMWGPNFDWIPDQDHGDNIITTMQCMLLQSNGRTLYVLPAWPRNWNVSFKLHAPYDTTVAGELRDGKLTSLMVTPKSRAGDVVNMLAK